MPEAALLRFRICQAADAIRHPDTQGLSGGRRFPHGASHQNFRYPERTFLRYLQNVGHGCLERHCSQFRTALLTEMDHFYRKYPGIYITKECLENSDTLPLLYSPVNHCVFVNDTWIPLEDYQKSQTTNNKNQVSDA